MIFLRMIRMFNGYTGSRIKYILLSACCVLFAFCGFAQQIPLYSQYYFNPFIYNPAMTGAGELANVFLIHRAQWTDMPGGPVTKALTLDGPIKKNKVGLGISLFNDATDITQRTGINASYSYRIDISDNTHLLFGLSTGALNSRIDFSNVIVKDMNDLSVFDDSQRKTTIDANFGLAFLWKKLEVGFAVPHLLGNSLKFANNDILTYYNFFRRCSCFVKVSYVIYVYWNRNQS